MRILRMGSVVILLLAGALAAPASGQQPVAGPAGSGAGAPPQASGGAAVAPAKVVLKVGDEQLTQRELDFLFSSLNPQTQKEVAAQGRRGIGERYALMILLSQRAVSDHLDSDPALGRQLELQRRQMLAQAEASRIAGQTTVGPDEVSQYYSTHASEFDSVELREVVARKRGEGAKEGPGLAPEEARTRLESIRKALASGTDAKKVAEDFKAPNDVMIDAEPRTVRRGQLVATLDKAAFGLKDGELSEPLDTQQALVLLQVVGHRHSDLKDVSAGIENTLRQRKFEAVVNDLKKKAGIWMDEDYFKAPQPAPTLSDVPSVP